MSESRPEDCEIGSTGARQDGADTDTDELLTLQDSDPDTIKHSQDRDYDE